MTMLTEEILWGEWFYLEEDEPFDPHKSRLFTLEGGDVRSDGKVVGTYTAGGHAVALEMNLVGSEARWTITLRPIAAQRPDATTAWLQADSEMEFADQEPWSGIGSFRRKEVDYVPAAAIRPLG